MRKHGVLWSLQATATTSAVLFQGRVAGERHLEGVRLAIFRGEGGKRP